MFLAGNIIPDRNQAAGAALQLSATRFPVRRAKRSKVQAVQVHLMRRILSAGLTGSRKLPSETSLERRLAVSRVTVRGAIDSLRDAGLINSYQGAGHFAQPVCVPVISGRWEPADLLFQSYGGLVEWMPVENAADTPEAALHKLRFAGGAETVATGALVSVAGVPVCFERVQLSAGVCRNDVAMWLDRSFCIERNGEIGGGYTASVAIDNVFAEPAVAGLMEISAGTAALRKSLALWAPSGRFAGLVQRYFHPQLVAISPDRGVNR